MNFEETDTTEKTEKVIALLFEDAHTHEACVENLIVTGKIFMALAGGLGMSTAQFDATLKGMSNLYAKKLDELERYEWDSQ